MRQVWVKARKAFSHGGTSYAAGQTFQLPPLVAVRMVASRAAVYSKPIPTTVPTAIEAPRPVEPEAAAPKQRARRVKLPETIEAPEGTPITKEETERLRAAWEQAHTGAPSPAQKVLPNVPSDFADY